MKCFFCDEEVNWQNDFDVDDIDDTCQYNIVSYYQCRNDNCGAWYEVYTDKKKEEDSKKDTKKDDKVE